jgi:hypothetical protein
VRRARAHAALTLESCVLRRALLNCPAALSAPHTHHTHTHTHTTRRSDPVTGAVEAAGGARKLLKGASRRDPSARAHCQLDGSERGRVHCGAALYAWGGARACPLVLLVMAPCTSHSAPALVLALLCVATRPPADCHAACMSPRVRPLPRHLWHPAAPFANTCARPCTRLLPPLPQGACVRDLRICQRCCWPCCRARALLVCFNLTHETAAPAPKTHTHTPPQWDDDNNNNTNDCDCKCKDKDDDDCKKVRALGSGAAQCPHAHAHSRTRHLLGPPAAAA